MSLPSDFDDEADGEACSLVGTAESVHHVEFFIAKFFDGNVFDFSPYFFGHGVVVVFVFGGSPPDIIVALRIVHDVFVFG